jgi:hypothetical protein
VLMTQRLALEREILLLCASGAKVKPDWAIRLRDGGASASPKP